MSCRTFGLNSCLPEMYGWMVFVDGGNNGGKNQQDELCVLICVLFPFVFSNSHNSQSYFFIFLSLPPPRVVFLSLLSSLLILLTDNICLGRQARTQTNKLVPSSCLDKVFCLFPSFRFSLLSASLLLLFKWVLVCSISKYSTRKTLVRTFVKLSLLIVLCSSSSFCCTS